ncbi:protein bicaudal C-like [Daphnia pulex]|uniref:protein bicaudal C-like n=1 Tax=Daphnia pulex TaxID=6669 RepID=UPI001EDE032C|nr:protein bicaudal C-like [Daphnia pulex]
MQLMVQVPSDRFNRSILADAKEADVMIRVERTTSDIVTIRFTSYEWNARNLYEMLRRCLELPSDQTVIPSLPSIWLELAELTQNTFILSSLKLAESSSSQSGPAQQQQQLGVIGVDIPQSSSTSSSDSGATSLSSPRAADSCIPASMAASRFDQNSSRHLSQLLDTVGLSHYADLFVQNEVDLAMFTTLKDEDFISIGIRSFGARKIMLNAIQELRR